MSEAFKVLTSKTLTLSQANIDTDQIIPARFLTTTTREGLGKAAFYDWRYEDDGSEKPEAVLNRIDPADVVQRMEQELAAREADLCVAFEPDVPAPPVRLPHTGDSRARDASPTAVS